MKNNCQSREKEAAFKILTYAVLKHMASIKKGYKK